MEVTLENGPAGCRRDGAKSYKNRRRTQAADTADTFAIAPASFIRLATYTELRSARELACGIRAGRSRGLPQSAVLHRQSRHRGWLCAATRKRRGVSNETATFHRPRRPRDP